MTGSDYWYAGSRYTAAEIQRDAMPAFKESADKPSKNAFLVNNQDGRSTDMVGSSVGNTPRALRRVQAKAKTLSPATINRYTASIGGLFTWCIKRRLTPTRFAC